MPAQVHGAKATLANGLLINVPPSLENFELLALPTRLRPGVVFAGAAAAAAKHVRVVVDSPEFWGNKPLRLDRKFAEETDNWVDSAIFHFP